MAVPEVKTERIGAEEVSVVMVVSVSEDENRTGWR